MGTEPIFLHSLFRTASTYFFSKFRALGCTCYQEPCNESLALLNEPRRHCELLQPPESTARLLRHPALDRPYMEEFWQIRDKLAGRFPESFSYERYFPDDAGNMPPDHLAYVAALIDHAAARPVLQFCRSSGRAGAMKRAFGGRHIHLWREPRAQWWSYKVTEYFDNANQRIYGSRNLPPGLKVIKDRLGIDSSRIRRLAARNNYLMFYGLWLDAWLRLRAVADLSVNVDAASLQDAEKARLSAEFQAKLGCAPDLAELRITGLVFDRKSDALYSEIEDGVHRIFVDAGEWTPEDIQRAGEAALSARRCHEGQAHDAAAQTSLCQSAMAMMDQLAKMDRAHRRVRRAILGQLHRLRRFLTAIA